MTPNPCLTCGACCAFFRASFYWAEADDATEGGVPVELTDDFPPHFRVMKGTNSKTPRCVALVGSIGESVFCAIHPRRATVCRDFPPSFENGIPHDRCDKARAAYNLPPLTLDDWIETDSLPDARRAPAATVPSPVIVAESVFAASSSKDDDIPPESPMTPPRPAA